MTVQTSILMAIVLSAMTGFSAQSDAADAPSPPANVQEEVRILEAPAGWVVEQIPIPFEFAPLLEFHGLEDIRFAPGWSVPGSPDFWTYKFAWEIAEDPQLDEERLSSMLETYYDGLSLAVSQLGDSLQAPVAAFVRDGEGYRGRVRVFDAFATNTWITLNARVNSLKRGEKHLLVCELSPQGFEHEVWQQLAMIRVRGLAPGAASAVTPSPAPAAGETAFARMLGLAGQWESVTAKGTVIRLTFEPISRGSALVERYEAGTTVTQTVYHRDGQRLVLTHYCAQGNQPRLVADLDGPADHLPFTFLDVTNLAGAGASRMVACEFTFEDADHFTRSETYRNESGDDVATRRYTRTAAPRVTP